MQLGKHFNTTLFDMSIALLAHFAGEKTKAQRAVSSFPWSLSYLESHCLEIENIFIHTDRNNPQSINSLCFNSKG